MEQKSPEKRALALDALRGFAILTMILSGRVPFGVLPGWMYHVQVPPPLHKFNPALPGISWVDLVFPFFLFSMGAAFPFALSKRREAGDSKLKLTGFMIQRGMLLAFFAVVIQHIRPNTIDPNLPVSANLLGLLTFGFLFLIFYRYPKSIAQNYQYILKGVGYLGIILFLWFISYPDGSGFSIKRFDIIILVLSNVAVVGSAIWLISEKNLMLRIGFIAICLAIRLSNSVDGSWINEINKGYGQLTGNFSPIVLFNFNFLKYLFIVLPGTIAGEIILRWINSKDEINKSVDQSKKYMPLAILMFAMILLLLVGMYSRMVLLTTVISIAALSLAYYSIRKTGDSFSKMILTLFQWGFFWLILGLLFEPFEGGIKKDNSTMSYYFITNGLALFMLIGFSIIIDYFRKQKFLQLLIDNGQNPMLAYAGGTNLLTPVVTLLYVDYFLAQVLSTPWLGVLKGIILTTLLALAVSFFTKRKIFWRS